MKHTKLICLLVTLIAALSIASAQADDGLRRVTVSHTKRELSLVFDMPARFPLRADTLTVTVDCLSGATPSSTGEERWEEWLQAYEPVLRPRLISFRGYTFGCDHEWFYYQAPNLDELLRVTGQYTGPGIRVWGRPGDETLPPSLIVELQKAAGVVALPLASPLVPRPYSSLAGRPYSPRSDFGGLLYDNEIIAARQSGSLAPVVFEQELSEFPFDPKAALEVFVEAGAGWEQILINVEDATLAYRRPSGTPDTEPVATLDLRTLRDQLDSHPPGVDLVVVRPGDTLWYIAMRHNVELDDLLRVNCLTSTAVLQPNTTLKLPNANGTPDPTCN